jgi:Flp pilus assembly protein TadD
VLLYTRRFADAERVYDRALELGPANLRARVERAMVALAKGDLGVAQAIIRAAPKEVDPTALVAYMAEYSGLSWVLDQAQQQLLLRLTPSAFNDDRGWWAISLAETCVLRGDRVRARAYADSARSAFERQLLETPDDPQLHGALGAALAYLEEKAAAIREGERGAALARDPWMRPVMQHQLARIYILVGEPEKALDRLEPLLKIPYYLSPGWLKIDPNFAPLRGNPRFERLTNGS